MDYSKLTEIKNRFKLTLPELAIILGITKSGLIKKIQNDTIYVKDIEKLAVHFNLPISFFFKEKDTIVKEPKVNYNTCPDCREKEGQIKLLNAQLESKDREIIRLNLELERIQPGEREEAGRNAGNF